MKLELHNFRCHTDATFDIPDSGLILLSGNSGSGKSTIIKAVLYALYGTKAVKKPYTFGATTCSVKLTFNGFKIVRTNKPNRLVVNGSFEDEPAQKIIDQKFGCYEEFIISSYIPQKNNSSILSLPPTEQIKIIKTLAINEQETENYKQKIKLLTNKTFEDILKLKSEYNMANEEINNLKQQFSIVPFPLKLQTGETELECIDRYNTRIKTFGEHLTMHVTKKNELEKQKNEYELSLKNIENLTEQLEKLNLDLTTISKLLETVNNINFELNIKQLQQSLNNILLQVELTKLETQFNNIKNAETLQTEAELNTVKNSLKNKNKEILEEKCDIITNILKVNIKIIVWKRLKT